MRYTVYHALICSSFFATYAAYSVAITCAASFIDTPEDRLSSFLVPFVEICFLYSLSATLWIGFHRHLNILGLLLSVTVLGATIFVYAAQGYSIIVTGRFITPLALDNIREVSYVTTPLSIGIFAVSCGIILTNLLIGLRSRKSKVRRYPIASVLAGIIATIIFGAIIAERGQISRIISRSTDLNIKPNLGPMVDLEKTYNAYSHSKGSFKLDDFVFEIKNGIRETRHNADIENDYPFRKTHLDISTFPQQSQSSNPLNVIVLFLEGTSARLMAHYGGKYEDLTPNLNAFAENYFSVDTYYNHTAATYRGLHGTLHSGYPGFGGESGWKKAWEDQQTSPSRGSLAGILSSRGYATRIYSPISRNSAFTDFLSDLGFETVITGDEINADGSETASTDNDLFSRVAEDISLIGSGNADQPFFWAIYNDGSHAFQDSPSDAVKYKDGENPALNRFHELDRSLKAVFRSFEDSGLSDSTILIVTADHSTYPEPSVVDAFSDTASFTDFFVDRIPLLIRHPDFPKPRRYENGVRTSLDLAPTILHLLNVYDVENAFLGNSIFDERVTPASNVAAIGKNFFEITKADGVTLIDRSGDVAWEIEYYQYLQKRGRILPPDGS